MELTMTPAPDLIVVTATGCPLPAGGGPRRRTRVQVRSLANTNIDPADPSTLLECERKFCGYVGGQGNGLATQAAYQLEALYLRAWLTRHAPDLSHPRHATGELLLAYFDSLRAAGAAIATLRRTASALRAYYGYLVIKFGLPTNPADVLPTLAEVVTEQDTHTEQDVAEILACAWQVATDAYQAGNFGRWLTARRDHAILAVLAYAGARRKETRGLRILDVDLDIDLPTGERLLTLHGKGGISRTIKIPSVLAEILDAYLTDVRPHFPANPYVFTDLHPTGPDTDEHGRPLPRLGNEVIYRLCYHYGTLAGIEGPCNPHSFRHSAATRLHAAGMSLTDIAAHLGHRSTQITLRYIHPSQEFLRGVLTDAFPATGPGLHAI
jgi:integrase